MSLETIADTASAAQGSEQSFSESMPANATSGNNAPVESLSQGTADEPLHNLMGKRGSLLGGDDPDNRIVGSASVPEKYSVSVPEGMKISEGQQRIFERQARELGLSNEQAQRLLQVSHENSLTHQESYYRQVKKWKDEVRNDREIGGTALSSTVAYAKAGLSKFDPEEKVFGLLQQTGYANHPDVIRFLSAIGKAHSEDQGVFGGYEQPLRPLHERLYGKKSTF